MLFYYVQKALIENYANFSGRASRSEYWYNVLFFVILGIALPALGAILSMAMDDGLPLTMFTIAQFILWLALIIPSLALVVRRLHDIGKSGWWYFIILIPCGVGFIWLLILMLTDSDQGPNIYGEKPED